MPISPSLRSVDTSNIAAIQAGSRSHVATKSSSSSSKDGPLQSYSLAAINDERARTSEKAERPPSGFAAPKLERALVSKRALHLRDGLPRSSSHEVRTRSRKPLAARGALSRR